MLMLERELFVGRPLRACFVRSVQLKTIDTLTLATGFRLARCLIWQFEYPDGPNSCEILNALTKTLEMGEWPGRRYTTTTFPKTGPKTEKALKGFRQRTFPSTHTATQTASHVFQGQTTQRVRPAADVSPSDPPSSFRVRVREAEPDRGGFVWSCLPRARYANGGHRRAQETEA